MRECCLFGLILLGVIASIADAGTKHYIQSRGPYYYLPSNGNTVQVVRQVNAPPPSVSDYCTDKTAGIPECYRDNFQPSCGKYTSSQESAYQDCLKPFFAPECFYNAASTIAKDGRFSNPTCSFSSMNQDMCFGPNLRYRAKCCTTMEYAMNVNNMPKEMVMQMINDCAIRCLPVKPTKQNMTKPSDNSGMVGVMPPTYWAQPWPNPTLSIGLPPSNLPWQELPQSPWVGVPQEGPPPVSYSLSDLPPLNDLPQMPSAMQPDGSIPPVGLPTDYNWQDIDQAPPQDVPNQADGSMPAVPPPDSNWQDIDSLTTSTDDPNAMILPGDVNWQDIDTLSTDTPASGDQPAVNSGQQPDNTFSDYNYNNLGNGQPLYN